MNTKLYLAAVFAIASSLFACEPKPEVIPAGPGQPASVGTATEVGQPNGNAVSQTIGPEGGRLATPDGSVELVLPAGAVKKATQITIQPIISHTPNGVGKAYRFSPDGLQFDKPAALTVHYTEDQISVNDAEMLKIAYQGTDKIWYNVPGVQVNTEQKRIQVPMPHFSDWSAYEVINMERYQLSTAGKIKADFVQYGETINLHMFEVYCGEDDALRELIDEKMGDIKDIKWSLIGAGKLESTASERGKIYVAPATGSKRIQVTVNVEITFQKSKKKLILVQPIYVGKNYVEITLNGQTRVYTDADFAFVRDQFEINAEAGKDNFYMVILGTKKGTFPFGDVLKSPTGVSAGHYHLGKYTYRTHFGCVGDLEKGLQVTDGSIVVEELVKDKLIKGTFSGTLMTDDPDEDCPTKLVPISGSFHISR